MGIQTNTNRARGTLNEVEESLKDIVHKHSRNNTGIASDSHNEGCLTNALSHVQIAITELLLIRQ